MLEPLSRMWNKVENSKNDSDIAFFFDLMYACEQVVKIATFGLIACLDKDPDDNRYRLLQKVVKADGIGEWTSVIDDILIGPSSFLLIEKAKDVQSELTSKMSNPSWQYGAVYALNTCLKSLNIEVDPLPFKVMGRMWFSYFAQIRNKTRGHGVPSLETCSILARNLETSLRLFENNFKLFTYSWAHLYRNMSGRYRVSKISSTSIPFDYLKEEDNHNLKDGVYIYLGGPRYVELISTTSDIHDFYFPNGGFGNINFELISYISGNKLTSDSTLYQQPASVLPSSETEGSEVLDVITNCFSNVPKYSGVYINRTNLECELEDKLLDDRHAIITLLGRGGIGKTSLALTVVDKLCKTNRFDIILWFSARDIDLLEIGAKPVKPKVLTEKDIANEYVQLINPKEREYKEFNAKAYFESELTKSKNGPTLFVMDNFETLVYPQELFKWLDTYIRLPNKILITSRIREFKGDYPIEVRGMTREEFTRLVINTSEALRIRDLVSQGVIDDLFTESSGHPYVAKVLLGEMAKTGVASKVRRIMQQRGDVLVALFERTYDNMTPAARRVFQTLCNWRTIIPRIAIEAILVRNEEYMNVPKAIDELYRFSLIDLIRSEKDGQEFISLPLSSFEFGRKKLSVSSMKAAIEVDTNYIRMFGPSTEQEIKKGIGPKVVKFFNEISKRNLLNKATFNDEYRPILILICGSYNPAWLLLAKIHEELNEYNKAKDAVQNFISNEINDETKIDAWEKISIYCRIQKDWLGEAHSYIEMCEISTIDINDLRNCASNLLRLLTENKLKIDTHEKTILIKRMTTIMESRLSERDFDSRTTLAWLYINLNDKKSAKKIIEFILSNEKTNYHVYKLAKILGIRI